MDEELRKKVAALFKSKSDDAESDEDEDEEEDEEESMDDDQMMQLDEQLAQIFKLRKGEKKDAKGRYGSLLCSTRT